ncbi:cohesin domain-containing protein [Rhodoferax sp. GW822-FHT02A01]|uniref:cohesin domain-containing protein n=1 Tax=Rhodoferax sp. GW822-FHT02A01 TaxID=3141537 RepID=UPI00315D6E32
MAHVSRPHPGPRLRNAFVRISLAFALGASLVMAGCAEQRLRDRATNDLHDGNYEQAIQTLTDGLSDYPESSTLRAGLSSAKNEAVARLTNEATQLRNAGKFDEADKSLSRALVLDPLNTRLLDLKADLVLARKQKSALSEISDLISLGKKEQALRRLDAVLRESPRQPELVSLQRRLQQEIRFEAPAQTGLAETRPITLDFKNAPLSAVLDAITRGSGVNFVLDKDVRLDTRATVYLREARVEDAIDLVVGANQLARNIIDAKTVFIYPNTPEKKREHQEQVVRVFYLANSPAQSTATLLRSMLRIKDPFVDERANMIAIREAPEVVALAERLVALYDLAEPEVMLEVEVMEVNTTILNNLGLDFPNSFTFNPLPESGASGLTVNSLGTLNGDRIGVSLPNLVLNLRREVGDSNILANPKIRARNKEKARILIGDKIPIITSTSSATGFVSQSVNYQEVGLKLDVEPIVSPDDDVTIKVGLEVSNLGSAVTTSSGTVAYQIGTRNANTTLRLRDGETQLLAGLINKQDISNAHRFPGLGDLPIAGRLFASQRDDKSRTELVLAITPRILRTAPRPDIAQAEMWVGSELASRLMLPPQQRNRAANLTSTSAPKVITNDSAVKPTQLPAGGATAAASSTPNPNAMTGAAAGAPGPSTATPVDNGPIKVTWLAPESVKAGDVFTVSLQLESGAPIRGVPLEIGFSATDLEVLDVTEGSLLKQDGATTSFTQSVNIGTGRIGVGLLRSDSTGIRGKGSVVELKLRVRKSGKDGGGSTIGLDITSLKPMGTGAPAALGELPALKIQVQ